MSIFSKVSSFLKTETYVYKLKHVYNKLQTKSLHKISFCSEMFELVQKYFYWIIQGVFFTFWSKPYWTDQLVNMLQSF